MYNGNRISNSLYNTLMGNPGARNIPYNAIGRTQGLIETQMAQPGQEQPQDNFFVKRGKSIENALGTTGAAIASGIYDASENIKTENMLKDFKDRMNAIAQNYGYNTYHDVWDARDKAEAEGDKATLDLIDNTINPQLRAQANTNADEATAKAKAYDDYRKNNYVSKKINQDRGKFLGSAMNTLSTGADVLTMAAGVPTGALVNAGQGAWEGVADELEQSGFEDFDWNRAGQNAAIGATTGLVTGGINKAVNNKLLAKGGNYFKGGNAVTKALNTFNETNPIGKTLSTIGSGIARGTQSGLVGGAVGAGLSSAINQEDIGQGIQNTLQGAGQGALQGAITGGAMAGANLAANATLNKIAPNAAKAIRENQLKNASYGDTLRKQFKGAWNSGDSGVAENIIKPTIAKVADTVGEATGKISTFAQNISFQNAIKNPDKIKEPVYLGELTNEDVSGIVEAYKKAGIDLPSNPEALETVSVIDGKMYLTPEDAQHIHDRRISGEKITPRQVRKVFRNATGENAVVSPELTDRGNATMGSIEDDNRTNIAHLGVNDDGTINVKTAYSSHGGKIANQIKSTLGSSELPSANASGSEGLPARTSALQGTDSIISQNSDNVNTSWQDLDSLVDRSIANAMPDADINSVKDTVLENVADKLQRSGIFDSYEAGEISDGDYRNYAIAAINDSVAELSNTPPANQPVGQTQATTSAQLSPWDRVAHEGGYANYDDAVQSYMRANPGVEVGPNDAGKILTWMDNNPGDWNPNAPQTTTRNPQTEVYETLNGRQETTSEVPTSKQIKNKRLLVEEITKQFNAVDKPTTRSTKPNETFYNLYEDWGLSDGDEIRQAVSYADQGALIPQMVREAAGETGVIDLSDAEGMVMDLKINKAASSKMINALENIIDSTDTTIIGGKQGVDALQLQRTLEQMASDARGTNGTYRIGNTVVDETMARNFDRIARNIGEKLDEAALSKGAVQNVLNRHASDIQDMKNAFPNNQKWQDAIDKKVLGANTIGDLRHSMRDLVRANIFINNGDETYSSFGGRYASNSDIPTSKATIKNRAANWLWDKIQESSPARTARLERYDNGMREDTATATQTSKNATNNVSQTPSYNAGTSNQLYNAIGRTEGLTNGEQARTASYITDATQSMNAESGYVAPLGVSQTTPASNTLEGLATPASTAIYNAMYGTPTNQLANQQVAQSNPYFQNTGDYWTDVLARAVAAAIDNNDVQAFSSLYSMYQNALSGLQEQAEEANKTTEVKLTDKQRQANAAARALEDFEQAQSNFGYDVSDIPVVGNIANFAGNDYLSKAEALALQIGYMLSGATINKDEAKKIGMAYVPQPRESAAARQSKLNQLRGIISDYQQTYAE